MKKAQLWWAEPWGGWRVADLAPREDLFERIFRRGGRWFQCRGNLDEEVAVGEVAVAAGGTIGRQLKIHAAEQQDCGCNREGLSDHEKSPDYKGVDYRNNCNTV